MAGIFLIFGNGVVSCILYLPNGSNKICPYQKTVKKYSSKRLSLQLTHSSFYQTQHIELLYQSFGKTKDISKKPHITIKMTVPRQCRLGRVTGIILALFASPSYSFTKPFNNFATISHSQRKSVGGRSFTSNYLTTKDEGDNLHLSPSQFSLSTTVTKKLVHSVALVSAILSLVLTTVPNAALADEYGVETEAPTLFTGESIMICVKRGPLGACQKTEERTPANDNDKAAKYFLEPGKKVVDKDLAMRRSSDGNMESELVTRLKQQTSDNKERNDQIVKMKSLENDQVSTVVLLMI